MAGLELISMLRIVHVGKYYPPDAGGIESVTASLARGAVRAGHDVSVICFRKEAADDDEVREGVRVLRVPIALELASQPLGRSYVRLCLRESRDADIVHLHTPNMLGALSCLLMGRGPRVLVHWHSDVVGKGLLARAMRPLETLLLRRADCIVATSSAYAEASPSLRRFRHKVVVAPLGSSPPGTFTGRPAGNAALPARLSAAIEGRRIILSVGRMVPYKGFGILVEAARSLIDDAIIVIVGGGPLLESLAARIHAAGLDQRVVLTGRLEEEALHELFRRACLFCMPSLDRAEAFGVVLLEAMAYGLPIVATRIPGSGVPWVNLHAVSGINVPVGDPSALAHACNRILESRELRDALARGAHDRYLTMFTEDRFVSRTLETYDRLVPQGRERFRGVQ
jgi:glycosyltransferase involved in cell wall biosynthesis